jgi:hypothetical protein
MIGFNGDPIWPINGDSIPIWSGIPTGWICPKCKRVYSPASPECWICNDQISLENNETTGNN